MTAQHGARRRSQGGARRAPRGRSAGRRGGRPPRAIAPTPPTLARARDQVTGIGTKVCALSRRRRLARRLAGRGRAARGRRPARPGRRRRRGHGDARDPPRRRARAPSSASPPRSPATRQFADNIRALRFDARLRRDRRRRPLLQREPVPGRPDRAGGQRRHRRRRAVLQLRRQRGQHARRHLRQLRGRLPRLGPRRRQVRRRGARLRSRARRCRSSSRSRTTSARRAGDAVLGRPARRAPRTTTTSTCSMPPATCIDFSQDVQDGDDDPYEILGTPTFGRRPAARGRALLRRSRATSS